MGASTVGNPAPGLSPVATDDELSCPGPSAATVSHNPAGNTDPETADAFGLRAAVAGPKNEVELGLCIAAGFLSELQG